MSRHFRRIARIGLVGVSTLALSGCFLVPGQFDSTLDLREDGAFTFSYQGEIHFVAMDDLAEMAEEAEGETFTPQPCYDDNYDERPCTEADLAEQEADWEAQRAEEAREAQMAAQMMSGVDLSDPDTAEAFAEALRKQAGWNEVTYVGEGMFEIDYAITSRMSHNFAFPAIPDLPFPSTFVAANLQDDMRVRIDAPGFTPQGGANPLQMMMGGMAAMFSGMGAEGEDGEDAEAEPEMPQMPQATGTFRIITDAPILANNTEDGPQDHADGQMLVWDIDPRTQSAPTALIQLEL